MTSPPLIVVFVRPEVCHDAGRIIPGAKGVAVTSDPRSTVDLSREDCYHVLSASLLFMENFVSQQTTTSPGNDRSRYSAQRPPISLLTVSRTRASPLSRCSVIVAQGHAKRAALCLGQISQRLNLSLRRQHRLTVRRPRNQNP